jgi:hypothetical protein
MQVVVRATLALIIFGACHTTVHDRPDAGTVGDGAKPDAPGSGSAGLSITWAVTPNIPGNPTTEVSVTDIAFLLVDANVTGDSGSVMSPALKLEWCEPSTCEVSGAVTSPHPVEFPSAPIGLYSKVALDIDGQLVDNSWWINGSAMVNGSNLPFKIYDRNSLPIALDIDTMLSPGKSVTVAIDVDLGHVFDAIDFSKIDNDDGTLVLDTDDDYMPTFVANLGSSFTVQTTAAE